MSKTITLAVGLCLMASECAATGDPPTIDEIVQGVKAREVAIRNFRVKADFKEKMRSRYTGKYLDSVTTMSVIFDFETGRFWYQKVAEMYNAPGSELHKGQEFLSEIEEVMAFDGEKTRQLTWSHAQDPELVKVSRVGNIFPGVREYWLTDPRDFIRNFSRMPISVMISQGVRTILRMDTDGLIGVEIVVPKEQTMHPDGYQFRARLWFDARKGMVTPRRELSALRPGDPTWIPTFHARLDDLFEIVPGIWLPRKYAEETYQVLPGKDPFLAWKRDV